MLTLIVQLPGGAPSANTAYAHALVQTDASEPALNWQNAPATLLPTAARQTEVVAVVPALALSWHAVSLPPGLHKQAARLKAALEGVLEERLLDDPAALHLSLAPDWSNTDRPWVAACDRAWLRAHLQALEAAGLTVHRIVPELSPNTDALSLNALGTAEDGWLWCSQAERGVWGLPLRTVSAEAEGLWPSSEARAQPPVQAEPAVVALASERLGMQAQLVAPGQHLLTALTSDWDLAQFEFQANAQSRRLKAGQRALSQLWHHSSWRPARWGLWLLLAANVGGLNAWAWKTRADWQAQQEAWTRTLQDSFPQTKLVVDAPLQMAQAVDRLRKGSGQLTAGDLESLLRAMGQALPDGVAAPIQWRYQTGQLQWPDVKLSASEQAALARSLAAKGYQWRMEGTTAFITPREGQP